MDFVKSLAIAAAGLRAQAGRMRVISENIANADSTSPQAGGDPYRRRIATFRSELDGTSARESSGSGRSRPTRATFPPNTSRATRPPTLPAWSNIPTSTP